MLITPAELIALRSLLEEYHHVTNLSVRKIMSYTSVTNHPAMGSGSIPVFEQFDTFKCTAIHIFSGKMNRIFAERQTFELLQQFSQMEGTLYVVHYVKDKVLTKGVAPIITASHNLEVDEELLIDGDWWKAKMIIPDSQNIQESAFMSR